MDYILHLLYGVGMSYLALISPGMLNMTALKIRINTGRRESLLFSAGAAGVVFIQASIALLFADFFVEKPAVIDFLKTAAVFVFFALALFFYFLSRKKVEVKEKKSSSYFLKGIGMSSLNMLAVPYYLALSLYLASEQKLILSIPYTLIFIFGSTVGTFLLFATYIYFARKIAMRVGFVVKNINLILSGLFVILGIFALINKLP